MEFDLTKLGEYREHNQLEAKKAKGGFIYMAGKRKKSDHWLLFPIDYCRFLKSLLSHSKYFVKEEDTPQDTPQDTNKVVRKEQNRKRLLEFCNEPRSVAEMIKFLGLKDRKNFMEGYLYPMLEESLLVMTTTDKPTSGKQKYVSNPK